MEKFTKTAMVGCAAACIIILVAFYVGSALGYADMGGTDDKVEGMAAQSGNKEASTPFEFNQTEQYLVYLLVGMIGGFVVGYAWTMVFDEGKSK